MTLIKVSKVPWLSTYGTSAVPIIVNVNKDTVPPVYFLPVGITFRLGLDMLRQEPRVFGVDARDFINGVHPAPVIHGIEQLPANGPCLVTCNHYSRTGFQAWWIAFAISAALPFEVHWTITSAWTFPGRPFASRLRQISAWLLGRIASVYGFSLMPPMPPDPEEAKLRAWAIRRVLDYAQRHPAPVIGLAPEGRDFPGGSLGHPPSGVGRFAVQLLSYCRQVLPVSIYEEEDSLHITFGQPYVIELASGLPVEARDRLASEQIMRAIARQLPPRLRGVYR